MERVLAEVLWHVGEAEEAERYVGLAQRLAAPDDWVGQWQWRGTIAKVIADRGERPEAERLAEEGHSMVDRTDRSGDAGMPG